MLVGGTVSVGGVTFDPKQIFLINLVWLDIVKKLNFAMTASKTFRNGLKKKEMLNLQPSTTQQCVIQAWYKQQAKYDMW